MKPLPEIDITPLNYSSVKINAWVAINYKKQYHLDKVLKKALDQCHSSDPRWVIGRGGSRFLERLYRRDLSQIGILGGNRHFRQG